MFVTINETSFYWTESYPSGPFWENSLYIGETVNLVKRVDLKFTDIIFCIRFYSDRINPYLEFKELRVGNRQSTRSIHWGSEEKDRHFTPSSLLLLLKMLLDVRYLKTWIVTMFCFEHPFGVLSLNE